MPALTDMLNAALRSGHFHLVRHQVRYTRDVDEVDKNGRTALMNCAFIRDNFWAIGLARIFLEHGAKLYLKDNEGLTAVHLAILQRKLKLVKLYLNCADLDLLCRDANGDTLLHYAVAVGRVDIAKLIVETFLKYKLTLDKTNKQGLSALEMAHRLERLHCVEFLRHCQNIELDQFPIHRPRKFQRKLAGKRQSYLQKFVQYGGPGETPCFVCQSPIDAALHYDDDAADMTSAAESLLKRRSGGGKPRRANTAIHWKTYLRRLYAEYDYQFSSSYRCGTPQRKYRRPESADVEEAGGSRSRTGRRSSLLSADSDFDAKSKRGLRRRISQTNLAPSGGRKQRSPTSTATSMSLDSDSVESGSTSRKDEDRRDHDALSAIKE